MINYARIENTIGKMDYYLETHGKISISTSGGSDSDVITHMIATYFRKHLDKIDFVNLDTGFEYEATKEHLKETEDRYGIRIRTIKSVGVVSAIKKEGVPIVSKRFSRDVYGASRGWQSCIDSLKRVRSRAGGVRQYGYSSTLRAIANYCLENKIRVSDICCRMAKEIPLKKDQKENGADLIITGERRAEGGRRATAHQDCFEEQKTGADKYMPLYFWDDETKWGYIDQEKIAVSKCYTLYGMKRTGCCGCPFGSETHAELEALKTYEPKKYKAVMNIFGESYRIMDMFHLHKTPIFQSQMTFEDLAL